MKHIKTASAEETQAKKEYAEVTSEEAIVADGDVEQAVRRLYEIGKKADEMELEASALRSVVMNYMKGHPIMTDKDGRPLCSWSEGNMNKRTDWEGLCKEFGIKASDINEFTTEKKGARRFSVEID